MPLSPDIRREEIKCEGPIDSVFLQNNVDCFVDRQTSVTLFIQQGVDTIVRCSFLSDGTCHLLTKKRELDRYDFINIKRVLKLDMNMSDEGVLAYINDPERSACIRLDPK